MKSQVLYAAVLDVKTDGGTTPVIDVSTIVRLNVHAGLTVLTGGTTPSVKYFYQEQEPASNTWVDVAAINGAPFTAPAAGFYVGFGAGVAYTAIGVKGRVRWAVIGAPTTATGIISIIGDPLT